MEAWVWLAAYLVGFALLQLVLYRYFQGSESAESESHEPGYRRLERSAGRSDVGAEDVDTVRETETATADTEQDAVVCQQCGALNERNSMFSYCRECASPLR